VRVKVPVAAKKAQETRQIVNEDLRDGTKGWGEDIEWRRATADERATGPTREQVLQGLRK